MTDEAGLALIITSVATLITAIGGVLIGLVNARKLTQVHESTNGKMEELLQISKQSSFAAGVKSETDKGIS
jgi:type III secretory pathway component EscS